MPSVRSGALGAAIVLAASLASQGAQGQTDAAIRPGDDFYRYANAAWLKATALPPGRATYDTTAMLRDETAERVRTLIEAAAKAPADDRAKRIGDYYAAWTDTAAIEAKGVQPLAAKLAAIAAVRDRHALAAQLGRSLRLDDGTNSQTEGLFGVWIHQGFHDPRRYAAHLVQGGLGLPDRDDYLDAGRAARRDLYRDHVASVLKLAGFDRADARAAAVLALEVAIARSHAPDSDAADVFTTDNSWRRADFAAKAPGLDWAAYFKAAGLARQEAFVVWQPSAVVGAATLARTQPIEAWRDYLAFHLIAHETQALPKAFRDEDAAFAGRLAGGPPAAPDRGQQAIAAATAALGQDIGRLYVARWFPPQAKAAAEAMAQNLRTALRAHIKSAAWMSPAQRTAALAKLTTLSVGLGYPDRWIDYSSQAARRDDALGNLRRAEALAYRRELAKLGQPVDPGEWSQVLPQQVGAVIYFSPNTLQFSAGLLQPPYFDPTGDAAANYGSAGAGMAHEISHVLDELGSLYDAQGRLARWWTPGDLARYRAALAPLAAQLDTACPKPDLCVKGAQVLGETSADLVGLQVAYDAYHLSLGGRPDVAKDGLTGDQRFFLAYAQRWRRVQTDAALARQIATDTHAPGEYRADMVRNLEAWRRAFDVEAGDRLYVTPQARFQIW